MKNRSNPIAQVIVAISSLATASSTFTARGAEPDVWQPAGYAGSTSPGYTGSSDTALGGGTLILQGSVTAEGSKLSMGSLDEAVGALTLTSGSEVRVTDSTRRPKTAALPAARIGTDAGTPSGSGTSLISTSFSAIPVESVVFTGFSGESTGGSTTPLVYGNSTGEPTNITLVPEPGTIIAPIALLGMAALGQARRRRLARCQGLEAGKRSALATAQPKVAR